jgi:hypothetical protein
MKLVSGLSFHNLANFSFCPRYPSTFEVEKIRGNNMVFLNLDKFNQFISILRATPPKHRFVLITQNSDKSFTNDHFKLIAPYVSQVYAINNLCNYDPVKTIPIGFQDSSLSIIQKCRLRGMTKKNILLYMNFTLNTNKNKRTECLKSFYEIGDYPSSLRDGVTYDISSRIKMSFSQEPYQSRMKSRLKDWVVHDNKVDREIFYSNLARARYVLCPEGTGTDCHRTYEAMYFDAIPIMKSNKMNNFFKTIPVVIVSDWRIITEEWLHDNYSEHLSRLSKWKSANPTWIYPTYWMNR